MAIAHNQSCEYAKSGLDVEYHPLSSITYSGPTEFNVSSSGQNYLDFSNTKILVKVRLTDADHVGGVNLFLHSLFQQTDVSLNDVQVMPVVGNVRLSRITLLSYGPQAKHSQLTAALFYKDSASNMDRPNPARANEDERNFGLQKKASFTDEGATGDMIGRIHSDEFFQDRFMLNEVNIKGQLVRKKDSFCLMSGEENAFYKVKIISVIMLVRKVQLSPSVFLDHAKALECGLAIYPISHVVCKTYTIPVGNWTEITICFLPGKFPARLVIG